jgi:hypothetical protein
LLRLCLPHLLVAAAEDVAAVVVAAVAVVVAAVVVGEAVARVVAAEAEQLQHRFLLLTPRLLQRRRKPLQLALPCSPRYQSRLLVRQLRN